MSDSVIADVRSWQALDSRGNPTVAAAVLLRDGTSAQALAPAGASRGTNEARELRDREPLWDGVGVSSACRRLVQDLKPAVVGADASDILAIDYLIHQVDPTTDLSRVGGNSAVALSLATLKAGAASHGREVWEHVAETWRTQPILPLPMVNILSGGAHAGVDEQSRLEVQDILVIPLSARDLPEAIHMVWRVRVSTQREAQARGVATGLVADEGGIAPLNLSTDQALELVNSSITSAGLIPGHDVALAIDMAGNQLATPEGRYLLDGRLQTSDDVISSARGWVRDRLVASIEDPLHDEDWPEWRKAGHALSGVQLLADDLVATQTNRLERALEAGVNAVLIKVNQAGTVSDAAAVLMASQAQGASTVISARSGDTEESWLADLAVGWGAGQIKVGSTVRSERTAKWNRLLALSAQHGSALPYAGHQALAGGPIT